MIPILTIFLSASLSLSIFPINLLLLFVSAPLPPPLAVLQPGLVVLSACSFHWQLAWHGCFVFSGRGQCVYLAQILNLFITTADLGGAQADSPRASSWRERWQARRGSSSLSILSRQWHGQSRLLPWPRSLYQNPAWRERLDCCSPLKARGCFAPSFPCKRVYKGPNWTHAQMQTWTLNYAGVHYSNTLLTLLGLPWCTVSIVNATSQGLPTRRQNKQRGALPIK